MFLWLWLCRWALPYLPCLTESWKQRQAGELGFIFIPQPGIRTEKEEGCCLVSFTSYAQRWYNFWNSHFCLFLTPQIFFLKSHRRNPELVPQTGFSAEALDAWEQGLSVPPYLQDTCQGGKVWSLRNRTCDSGDFCFMGSHSCSPASTSPWERSVPPAFSWQEYVRRGTQLAKDPCRLELL